LAPDVTEPLSTRQMMAARLRGTGLTGIAALLVISATAVLFTPAAAVLILLWAWVSKTPWRSLGLYRPRSWFVAIGVGVALGIVEKLLMKAVIMPLLGAPAVNPHFGYLADKPRAALFFALYAIVGAGFAEELLFRGYLIERIEKLLATVAWKQSIAILISTVIFASLHYQQGAAGVENAAILGLLAALIYVGFGRNLWPLVVMHAIYDLLSLCLIYFHLEEAAAHLVFR
jgi:membrane protease YdiL (CAAX protease family)